jgi:hypothetical protein
MLPNPSILLYTSIKVEYFWMFTHHHLLMGLLTLGVLTGPTCSAVAAVTESECAAVRMQSSDGEHVFFQVKARFFPVQQNKMQFSELIKSSPPRIRLVYLTKFDGDESPTLVSSIIRFLIANPEPYLAQNPQYSKVYTYSNLRDTPLWVAFDDYQRFHSGPEINHQLSEWFHVGPGPGGWSRNLFRSSTWELPRRFFFITGNHPVGEGIYSFLLALRGMNPSGTCFDTWFILPPNLREFSVVFRNLRAQTGLYPEPIQTRVEFPE